MLASKASLDWEVRRSRLSRLDRVHVLSYDDMNGWNMLAKSLRKEIGAEPSSVGEMRNRMDEDSYGVVVRSKTYRGAPEIAAAFRNLKVTEDDVRYMTSVNAKKNPIWGDLAAGNDIHLYFVKIDVV